MLPYLECSVWFISHLRDVCEEQYLSSCQILAGGAGSLPPLSLDLSLVVTHLIRLRCLGSLSIWVCCCVGLPLERLLSSRRQRFRGAVFRSRLLSLSFDWYLWLLGRYESPITHVLPVLAVVSRPSSLPHLLSRLSSWGYCGPRLASLPIHLSVYPLARLSSFLTHVHVSYSPG